MKKRILAILIVFACAIWLHNAVALFGKPKLIVGNKAGALANAGTTHACFVYKPDFRDPFYCPAFMAEPAAVAHPKKAAMQPRAKVILPPCKIGGIVYNPQNPMAIFIHGNKSELVKQGDMIDSILIRKITADSVEVTYRKMKFVWGI